MRIIAGKMRGRRLKHPDGWQTRPTSDKVKGAVFNVLRFKVQGARVLDLFAGTGSLALEAMSRGADSAVLVENNQAAARSIMDNINLTGIGEAVTLHQMDAFTYLTHSADLFDLIFLDPPYHRGLAAKALARLAEPCRLTPAGVLVVETARDEELNENIHPFEVRQIGEYGDTKIWYLQRTD